MGARYLPVKAFEVDVTHIRGTWWWKLQLIWLSCCPRLRNLSDQVKFPVWVSGPTFNSQILQVPSAMDQGWIKSRLPGLFRPDSFRTLMYYRQFQKFLLVTDNFGPNRFGKICAEVTFSVIVHFRRWSTMVFFNFLKWSTTVKKWSTTVKSEVPQ